MQDTVNDAAKAAQVSSSTSGGEMPQGWFKRALALIRETGADWSDDEASRLAASLAFYTVLSLAPLLMLSIAVAGFFLGDDAAGGEIARKLQSFVGASAGNAIGDVSFRAATRCAFKEGRPVRKRKNLCQVRVSNLIQRTLLVHLGY